jgi:F-type H+-transporting ATPase subunit b
MLIDWFTVGAQVLNFLILVWLLKRFLYKPILDAIDARESESPRNSRTPTRKKTEAEKERDEVPAQERGVRRAARGAPEQATDEAKSRTSAAPREARQAADALRAKRQEAHAKREQQVSTTPSPAEPSRKFLPSRARR